MVNVAVDWYSSLHTVDNGGHGSSTNAGHFLEALQLKVSKTGKAVEYQSLYLSLDLYIAYFICRKHPFKICKYAYAYACKHKCKHLCKHLCM